MITFEYLNDFRQIRMFYLPHRCCFDNRGNDFLSFRAYFGLLDYWTLLAEALNIHPEVFLVIRKRSLVALASLFLGPMIEEVLYSFNYVFFPDSSGA